MQQELKPVIVACLDISSNSSGIALNYACQIAKKLNFDVHILVIVESSKGLLFVSRLVEKDKRVEVEKKLKKLIESITKEVDIKPTISIKEGDVVQEISKKIKSMPNSIMLVLGKDCNKRGDNNILPKLSAQIGNKIKVPVVIVPSNIDDKYITNLLKYY